MSTSIMRHPDDATLVAYAAGTLSEALAAAVAAHASMCRLCRREIADMEAVGDVLLGALAGDGREGPRLARTVSPPRMELKAWGAVAVADRLPAPLARHFGLTFATIPWRMLAPGVWHHRLPLPSTAGDLRLLRISKGLQVPEHGHGGTELTLVIDGAYADSTGRYCRGDIQDVDADTEHSPVADAEMGCICLIASEHRAKFKGVLGRMIGPLTGL